MYGKLERVKGQRRWVQKVNSIHFYGGTRFELCKTAMQMFVSFKICQKCGKEANRVHIHHKDRDTDNNTLGNLMVLCAKCHKGQHLKLIYPQPAHRKRKIKMDISLVKEMRTKGNTYAKIGEYFSVSRQRIHQILMTTKSIQ